MFFMYSVRGKKVAFLFLKPLLKFTELDEGYAGTWIVKIKFTAKGSVKKWD